MSGFKVVFDSEATDELAQVPKNQREAIAEAIRSLPQFPRVQNIKRLEGFNRTWRLAVGSYRVVFVQSKSERKLTIVGCANRNDFYDKKVIRRLQNAEKRHASEGIMIRTADGKDRPHADWAKGVTKAWKKVLGQLVDLATDVTKRDFEFKDLKLINDTAMELSHEVGNVLRFIERTATDIKINKGLFVRVPKKIDKSRGTINDMERTLQFLQDAAELLSDSKTRMLSTGDALNPQTHSYHRDFAENEDRWQFAARGMGHVILGDCVKADKAFAKAMKYVSDVKGFERGFVPDEVDHHGMKIIFQDQKGIAPAEDNAVSGKDRHPVHRDAVVRSFDRARALLERKGLGFLWYGQTIVHPTVKSYKFVTKDNVQWSAAAHYVIGKDSVESFMAHGDNEFARFLVHELGHRFWFKFLTEADRAEFADQFGDVAATTQYGGTSAEEDFAEVFAHYVDGEDLTRDQLERFKKFIDNHKRRKASAKKPKRARTARLKAAFAALSQHTAAQAPSDEYPHRDWANGLFKGWQQQVAGFHQTLDGTSDTSYASDMTREVKGLREFITRWLKDARINRGFHNQVPRELPPENMHGARAIYYLEKALKELPTSVSKPQNRMLSSDALDQAATVANMYVTEAVKEFNQDELQWEDSTDVQEEFSHHDMKVVAEDAPVWDEKRRARLVSTLDEVYATLRNKKLGWLWRGELRLVANEQGAPKGAAAWYQPTNDTLGLIKLDRRTPRDLIHEIGHRFWFKNLTETDRNEFRAAVASGDVDYVTSYAKTDADEAFAEAFAHYVYGQDMTRGQLEQFRRYLDNHKSRTAATLDDSGAYKKWIHGPAVIEYRFDPRAGAFDIASLRVPPKVQGQGLARDAMKSFLAATDAAEKDVKLLASPLTKATKLAQLVRFYESLGFKVTGRGNPAGDPVMIRTVARTASTHTIKLYDHGGLNLSTVTCQFCGREFTAKKGMLPRHGWREKGRIKGQYGRGHQTSACPGSAKRAMEETNAYTAEAIQSYADWIKEMHKDISTAKSAEFYDVVVSKRGSGNILDALREDKIKGMKLLRELVAQMPDPWGKGLTSTDAMEVRVHKDAEMTPGGHASGKLNFKNIQYKHIKEAEDDIAVAEQIVENLVRLSKKFEDGPKTASVRTASIRYETRYHSSTHGQQDASILAFDGTELVGYVDFTVYHGIYHIKMVEALKPGLKVGQELLRQLAKEAGGWKNVNPGYKTDAGEVLFKKMDQELGAHYQPPQELDPEPLVRKHKGRIKSNHPMSSSEQDVYVEFDDEKDAQAYIDEVKSLYELEHEPDLQAFDGQAWVDVILPRTASIVEYPMAQRLRAQHDAWSAVASVHTDQMAMPEELRTLLQAWVRDIDKNTRQWELFKPCAKAVKAEFTRALALLDKGDVAGAQRLVDSGYRMTGIYGRTAGTDEESGTEAFVAALLGRQPGFRKYMTGVTVKRSAPTDTRHPEATTQGDTILLFPKFDALDMRAQEHVFAHELGHVYLSRYGLSNWVNDANKYGIDPWDTAALPYGMHNFDEAFAEAFAVYLTDARELERAYPRWSAMLDEVA